MLTISRRCDTPSASTNSTQTFILNCEATERPFRQKLRLSPNPYPHLFPTPDFAKLHLGSNLERIARSSNKPVFVTARSFREIAKVLVAYDGGPSAMKAVDHMARSPLFAGLDIRLLTVGQENVEARRALEGAQATLKAGGHQASVDLAAGQPEKVIAETVERDRIDLLVMGAYAHSRIRSFFIGSTTAEMIRACKIPVFLFR